LLVGGGGGGWVREGEGCIHEYMYKHPDSIACSTSGCNGVQNVSLQYSMVIHPFKANLIFNK